MEVSETGHRLTDEEAPETLKCFDVYCIAQAWISTMAAFVKSLDSNHLLGIGEEGFYPQGSPGQAADPLGAQTYVTVCPPPPRPTLPLPFACIPLHAHQSLTTQACSRQSAVWNTKCRLETHPWGRRIGETKSEAGPGFLFDASS